MGDLTAEQQRALDVHKGFITSLDTTEMVKSYKMLVLLAMIDADRFPGSITIDESGPSGGTPGHPDDSSSCRCRRVSR